MSAALYHNRTSKLTPGGRKCLHFESPETYFDACNLDIAFSLSMAQSVARMPSASYPASSSSLGRTRVAPASPSKAVAAEDIADDADPTYTHFAHREQVAELLSRVLALDMSAPAGDGEDEAVLVSQIGAIVSAPPEAAHSSSTTTSQCRAFWILPSRVYFPLLCMC